MPFHGEPEPHDPITAVSVADALRTSLAENTRRAYRSGWRRFAAYCEERQLDPMAATPENVAEFLVAMASGPGSGRVDLRQAKPLAPSTIKICLAAINRQYKESSLGSPARHETVRSVLRGLRRLAGEPPRRVKALRENEIRAILSYCDRLAARRERRALAIRDAAVVAVGFAGALRRSEICGLRVADIEFLGSTDEPGGMFLHIRRSKTDQLGRGQRIAVPEGSSIRPVERMRRWLSVIEGADGPAFQSLWRGGRPRGKALHPTEVARVVKRCAEAIGLDPADYSGHSLRAGFVTSAAAHGARLDKIMDVTRHASAGMVLRYIRLADAFEDHAGDAFL